MDAKAVKGKTPMWRVGKAPSKQGGFTYAIVLVAIVVVGILAEVAHISAWRTVRAEREAELLFRGMAYRRAIESFYKANGSFPRELEDLLQDPQGAGKRHLRALYSDPMVTNGERAWVLIRAGGGGIVGVASASDDEPLKKANFPVDLEKFAAAKSYKDWIFEYVPPAGPPGQRPAPGRPAGAPSVLKTF